MGNGRIAPIRPSIAKILKRQIGGFVREYEREANRPDNAGAPAPAGDAAVEKPAPARPEGPEPAEGAG